MKVKRDLVKRFPLEVILWFYARGEINESLLLQLVETLANRRQRKPDRLRQVAPLGAAFPLKNVEDPYVNIVQ